MKDSESRLRDGDAEDVFGADADGGARFRQNDKLISVNGTLVLDRVRPHLKDKSSLAEVPATCSQILRVRVLTLAKGKVKRLKSSFG